MDLSTILNKIHNNEYVDVQQIRDDLFLTADNAVQFNGEILFQIFFIVRLHFHFQVHILILQPLQRRS